jgi:hypothetical protein
MSLVFALVLQFALPLALAGLVVAVVWLAARRAPAAHWRRLGAVAAVGAAALTLDALNVFDRIGGALFPPPIVQEAALPGLRGGALTVGVLHDVDLGAEGRAAELAAALGEAAPDGLDLLLFVGAVGATDAGTFAPLRALSPREGMFGVLSDSDWAGDALSTEARLSALGVRMLANEAVPVEIGRRTVWVAGVESRRSTRGANDPALAIRRVPEGASLVGMGRECCGPGADAIPMREVRVTLACASRETERTPCRALGIELRGGASVLRLRSPYAPPPVRVVDG